ncbi:hypothetical protein CF15_01015 [Pyrodictium occultum]|uniref:Uncharacterized protein n=1 Tax=Pyrodictium occultum TaxID=2309 RepID=A0A0V8RTS7_PYROC|nr:hypothetical protein [Pyrodictium occultum]KSW11465.1 hypothetical protein CF15_01015 [Pyrodictium occultum]
MGERALAATVFVIGLILALAALPLGATKYAAVAYVLDIIAFTFGGFIAGLKWGRITTTLGAVLLVVSILVFLALPGYYYMH